MINQMIKTLSETDMSKPQVAYAIARAHLETLQAERNEICKAELQAYEQLTGNEPEDFVDKIIDDLTNAEVEADIKLNMYQAEATLEIAENDLIKWGREIVMGDKRVKANSTPTDYEMVMSLFEKALNGHHKARPKVVEMTFNLRPD